VHRKAGGFEISEIKEASLPLAFIGISSCDLAAIAILDKIMMEGPYQDLFYKHKSQESYDIAVNCTRPSGTCFCTSMKTGPRAKSGFDLVLTEVVEENQHYYMVESGSKNGEELIKELPVREASQAQLDKAHHLLNKAAGKMGRSLETDNLKDILSAILKIRDGT
jgi:sulfhydrogenase subunit beta (sulfur reductase)